MNISIYDLDMNDSDIFGKDNSDRSSSAPRLGKKAQVVQKRKAPQRFNGIHRRRRKKIMW
jgi:hypothetical protein